ncbi:MAG: hypothetical protein RID15_13650 [Marinovum algicola]|jgi:hypothetical protein|uniref:hypothetical protein n=1 Tax=Marinovum TaxID=367771 RepID=UPI00237BC658|nr:MULTISPECIES: hypothetical protein [Marinovum]MDD9738665.1 hypothetical protein [Marinovum sp. SP66]
MSDRPRHLFVERQTYRRRRLQDAARFLPVLGIVLMMVPLLWSEGAEGVTMSGAVIYLFLIWAALVAAAMVLSLYLHDDRSEPEDSPPESRREAGR